MARAGCVGAAVAARGFGLGEGIRQAGGAVAVRGQPVAAVTLKHRVEADLPVADAKRGHAHGLPP